MTYKKKSMYRVKRERKKIVQLLVCPLSMSRFYRLFLFIQCTKIRRRRCRRVARGTNIYIDVYENVLSKKNYFPANKVRSLAFIFLFNVVREKKKKKK